MSIFRTTVQAPQGLMRAYPKSVVCAPRVEAPARPTIQQYALKRVLDFTLATAGLVVSASLWLLIACAIKLEDGGPVFYVQSRWGRNKRPFSVYKFRSMVVDADERFGAVQATENDQRFTRMGRFLRATSFDELPQLLNIWRGEMSWVGPRALPINEKQLNESGYVADDAVPGFDSRCAVQPGLTGIAQLFASRDVPRRQKFRYDNFYVKHQSLWLDLRLIALSFWVSFRLGWKDGGRKARKSRPGYDARRGGRPERRSNGAHGR